jgi:hypothetical protein
VDLAAAVACGHCATPFSMGDPQQLRRELDTLARADTRGHAVDPTLPIRLMQERAAAERTWAGLAGDKSWVEELLRADGTDGIATAAIRLLSTRVG